MGQGPERIQSAPGQISLARADGAEVLSKWYTPQTTYVGEAALTDPEDGIARISYRVPDYQCGLKPREILRGAISREGAVVTNELVVDAGGRGHTEGHLKTLRLFAGNLGIGMINEAVLNQDPSLRMAGARFFTFQEPTFPGDLVQAKAEIVKQDDSGLTVAGDVFNREGRHTFGRAIRFVPAAPISEPESIFPVHPIYEVLAQDAGIALYLLQGGLPKDMSPVYFGVGTSKLTDAVIRAGDLLVSTTRRLEIVEQDNGILSAQFEVGIKRGDETVAEPTKVKFGLLPNEMLKKLESGQDIA